MGLIDTVIEALWLFLPAYIANMTPVFAAKIIPGWNARMDGGRMHKDGRPMLGPNKTWRGLVSGVVVGAGVALIQSQWSWSHALSDFHRTEAGLFAPVVIGAAMGFGAGFGDAIKSYYKRRTGRKGGAPWVPFDQLDFVAGGLLYAFIASVLLLPLSSPSWFDTELLGSNWPRLLVILLLTPLLHFVVNVIGYFLKLKKVPW